MPQAAAGRIPPTRPAANAALLDVLGRSAQNQSGQPGAVITDEVPTEADSQDDTGDSVEGGSEAQVERGYLFHTQEMVDGSSRPMEQRRLVHRRMPIFERKEHLAVLDHLLNENALDRFVCPTQIGRASCR